MDHPLAALAAQTPPFDPADTPDEATLRKGGRELALTWRDGGSGVVGAEAMRLACRCAWCTRARVEDRFPSAFEAVAVTGVEPLGGYAVHLTFSDGHDRGIFPWTYLRRLATETAAPARAA
ncbi:hypothetical protein GCM10008171_31090 [Methylopila jiangsuensis]|uniref:Gamma-butyrobetaine hydroxylase-like N-terminal domain-containing protein n=1 Tax=Methylopila jiangsuensis TaxID=586230 RepID=A0A9W6JL63_9HYPH|nr:DUF971 domain-containing protein [Methylopila jiangsuensis]MDR6284755.1 DUF971 family protein [Methylopila jiangsuensis]GLK77855.1 hypothetical protein GCM10008171_31090 [Methylopila jiangsuensis]